MYREPYQLWTGVVGYSFKLRQKIRIKLDFRVSNLLNRLIWNECEGDSEDYEILSDDLDARLEEAARSPDFETLPIEVIAQRVMRPSTGFQRKR